MPAKPHRVVTVEDIARATGLSASSVSAVLSGRHVERRISSESVELVLAEAKKLRYVPNVSARNLRTKGSGIKHVVLTVMTSYEVPVFLVSHTLKALSQEIAKRAEKGIRYTVNIEMFHGGFLHEMLGLEDEYRYNGAIITNTIDTDDQFLAAARLPFPVVLLGRRIPGYASVSARSDVMGRKAAEILLEAGRQKLAVLQPAMLTQATRSRLAAFIATSEHVTGVPPMIITCDGLQEPAGFDAMERFLARNPACDGIFALADGLAIGAYWAIKKSGRAIPRDVAMIGVGDNPASNYIDPPLTCFKSAEESQHQAAAHLLLELVNGSPPKNLSVDVPVAALLRESTGHANGGS